MSTTTKDFLSIGILAGQLHVRVGDIEKTADRLGVAPAMRLNDVPYFDNRQVERITAAMSERDANS